jgi:hypothetical protein
MMLSLLTLLLVNIKQYKMRYPLIYHDDQRISRIHIRSKSYEALIMRWIDLMKQDMK